MWAQQNQKFQKQDRHDLMSFLSSQVKQSLVSKATSSLKCWSSMQFSPQVQDSGPLAQETFRRFEDQEFNISKVGRCAALLGFGAMLRSYTHDA